MNSQPWHFVHDGETIHVYCLERKLIKKLSLARMNRIDIGICLAHMYVTNPDSFRFFKAEGTARVPGYYYIGSMEI